MSNETSTDAATPGVCGRCKRPFFETVEHTIKIHADGFNPDGTHKYCCNNPAAETDESYDLECAKHALAVVTKERDRLSRAFRSQNANITEAMLDLQAATGMHSSDFPALIKEVARMRQRLDAASDGVANAADHSEDVERELERLRKRYTELKYDAVSVVGFMLAMHPDSRGASLDRARKFLTENTGEKMSVLDEILARATVAERIEDWPYEHEWQVQALVSDVRQLAAIVAALARVESPHDGDHGETHTCRLCLGETDRHPEFIAHAASCPWVRAKALAGNARAAVAKEARCADCGAMWRVWSDGTLSLVSKTCGPCCDNVKATLVEVRESVRCALPLCPFSACGCPDNLCWRCCEHRHGYHDDELRASHG